MPSGPCITHLPDCIPVPDVSNPAFRPPRQRHSRRSRKLRQGGCDLFFEGATGQQVSGPSPASRQQSLGSKPGHAGSTMGRAQPASNKSRRQPHPAQSVPQCKLQQRGKVQPAAWVHSTGLIVYRCGSSNLENGPARLMLNMWQGCHLCQDDPPPPEAELTALVEP